MKNIIKIHSRIPSFNQTIVIPGDKSISIRCILLGAQANGKSKFYNLLESEDVNSAINAVKSLGVKIKKKKTFHEISGVGLNGFEYKKNLVINCGNSGTLARLLCGMLAGYDCKVKIIGDKSLSRRDFSRVVRPLKLFGVNFQNKKKLPIKISGSKFLRPINYFEEKGSAQVKSSIMLAALNTPGITSITSKPSRNHTENILKYCLRLPIYIAKKRKLDVINLEGQKDFKSFDYKIPGDISSAAFFIVLTLLSKNSKLKIKSVNVNESRTGILTILKRMGANIKLVNKKFYNGEHNADLLIKSTKEFKSINCPSSFNTKTIDEFLIIFLVCAKANGTSRFNKIDELRQKESDRLKFAAQFLKRIGIKVKEKYDSLTIYGNPNLKLSGNFIVKNFLNDHRVFMMTCIAALSFGGKFKIHDKNSINSSFPNFLRIIRKLGAKIN